MSSNYTPEEIAQAHRILYNEGIKMRYQVAGKEYVDKALANADNPFSKAMQEVTSLPSLPSALPSFALLALNPRRQQIPLRVNRSQELATHVKGAMNNGATEEEIKEVILQAACYCGMPSGIEGFRVAWKAIEEWRAAGGKEAEKKGDSHHVDEHRDMDLGERAKPEDV
ncbi:unnamed protein product [Zymoseptoria tritici ST99CH_3D1]|nr:unnamed protein product [Zymoseptoria tritici ST99CH_3D1]